MNISNLIVIAIVITIVALVSVYLWNARKGGVKCIGCPDGKSCSGSCAMNGEGCPGGCGHMGGSHNK